MISHIRIVSPSGAIDPSYIDGAVALLRRWGFEVTEGAHARGEYGRFAGTDEERLADLSEALGDPTVDAILCARGGYGLQRIIDRVPPEFCESAALPSFGHAGPGAPTEVDTRERR